MIFWLFNHSDGVKKKHNLQIKKITKTDIWEKFLKKSKDIRIV